MTATAGCRNPPASRRWLSHQSDLPPKCPMPSARARQFTHRYGTGRMLRRFSVEGMAAFPAGGLVYFNPLSRRERAGVRVRGRLEEP
jgi:hypothetical protein